MKGGRKKSWKRQGLLKYGDVEDLNKLAEGKQASIGDGVAHDASAALMYIAS